MMNRREALKTLALSAGAAALAGGVLNVPGAEGLAATTGAPRDTTRRGGPAPGAAAGARDTTAATAPTGPFTLPPLPYPPDALEPHLDARTMQLHHDAHHAAYVNNLNKAVAGKPDLERLPLEAMLRGVNGLPENVRAAVRNHGGGHSNHSLLWTSLSKTGAREPVDDLKTAIDATFGSFSAMQDGLRQAATAVFGSGWAWLSTDGKGALKLEYTQNQDSPLMVGRVPLLGIDVWEHAYYLKFQSRRAEYIHEFLQVVDWSVISTRFRESKQG